jgi:TusA-related sulfurtransferase
MPTDTRTTIDCHNENCPMPLVKTRQAILKAKKGDLITVVGDHPQSYDEIPMALEVMEMEIKERSLENGEWRITFAVS